MPRSAEVVAKLREAQRDRILEAAINVFGRGGMSATMDDVAAGAGVSRGLAYRYFAGGGPGRDAHGDRGPSPRAVPSRRPG
jgi:AcrR family transcriptional regulator